MRFNFKIWIRLAIFNLLVVAFLGAIMRYKIGYEFPFFNQKNLQHAHSHFAFSGWISLMIMLLMLYNVRNYCSPEKLLSYSKVLFANNLVAFGMLVTFAFQGYDILSITFSTLSIIVIFWFCYKFYFDFKLLRELPGMKWLKMAILFNIISTIGTLSLSYMMASKQIGQHSYLASVYWYLHFQYNGWFFFASVGIFINYLHEKNITLLSESKVFNIFSFACVPAYGLSILWLNLPVWLYAVVVLAALLQAYALFVFLKELDKINIINNLNLQLVSKLLLFCVLISIVSKITLQLGSTIPLISKFAFGFRPIVIAYLHLVLLAFTSVFLIVCAFLNDLFYNTKTTRIGLILFLIGIVTNEILLGLQGVFSISYTVIPYANELLFFISLCIFLSILLINISQKTVKPRSY
jgi:hypothetical protein